RFVAAGSIGAAYISDSVVSDADKYAQAFPAGGLTLEYDGTTFVAQGPNSTTFTVDDSVPGELTITEVGVTFTLSGTPGAGSLHITAGSQETQNILNTIVQLRRALEEPADGVEGGNLRIREAIATALGNIDSGMMQIESTQAHIGARLNSIDTLKLENESLEVYNAETQSLIRDTDIPEATSRLILQQAKLEAAQAAFMRVSQLSLFDRM